MTLDEYNAFCGSLTATTHVVQWGNAHVWKVGGKVFAIGGWHDDGLGVTFKAGDLAYEVLQQVPGCRPAPYLASRGMKWIQSGPDGLSDDALKKEIVASHERVAAGLSKKKRAELGLDV